MNAMTEWSESGYDLSRQDRWLYGFVSIEHRLLKLGLVLREDRIRARLREIKRKSKFADLNIVWARCLPSVTHEEAEHMEGASRLWLARSGSLDFVGKVDWLAIRTDINRVPALLDRAVLAAASFGQQP